MDRKPVVLVTDVAVPPADQRGDFAAWEKGVLDGPQGQAALAGLAGTATRADLALLPRHDCMASRLLVPLFSTSATAVLTHFSEGDGYAEETLPDGTKRM
ncbi:MAG: hypothetical protein FJ087_10420, partial [Deltaproteobacteria bacterium]|nr:hypothetical protein [Deltaproteobacteria bacterium]